MSSGTEGDVAALRDMREATHNGYAYITVETLGPGNAPDRCQHLLDEVRAALA
jgi:hypothetical protein